MIAHYALGLDLLLSDGATPDGGLHCRDELLFQIIGALVRFEDDYSLREIVPGDAPLECPCEDVPGERVIVAGYERGCGIGGPIRAEDGAAIIADVDRAGRRGMLEKPPLATLLTAAFAGRARAVILPPYCATQRLELPALHPLHDVTACPAAELRNRIAPFVVVDEVARLHALLELCIRHRLVMSAAVAAA